MRLWSRLCLMFKLWRGAWGLRFEVERDGVSIGKEWGDILEVLDNENARKERIFREDYDLTTFHGDRTIIDSCEFDRLSIMWCAR
jgi:hypothetical protein